MRDSKGCFIHGHTPLTERDPDTGKFIMKSKEAITVEEEVDKFLAELENERSD